MRQPGRSRESGPVILTVVTVVVGAALVVVIVGVVVALLTDDRDPSMVLAWLFVIMLLPVLGVVAYFFIGRNYRREHARHSERRESVEARSERASPRCWRPSQGFSTAAVATLERHARAAGRDGRSTRGRHRPAAGGHVRALLRGGGEVPRPARRPARRAERYIHLMYLIWEQDELTAEVTDDPPGPAGGRASRCTSSTTGSPRSRTRRRSSSASPRPVRPWCRATSGRGSSTTATT